MTSRVNAIGKLLFIDLVGSVVWFPLWWYTTGFQRVANTFIRMLTYRVRSYALRVWLRNFFVPMYGQYDWAGQAISLLMRLVVFVWRLIELAVEALVYLFFLMLWILAPIFFLCMGVLSLLQGFRV